MFVNVRRVFFYYINKVENCLPLTADISTVGRKRVKILPTKSMPKRVAFHTKQIYGFVYKGNLLQGRPQISLSQLLPPSSTRPAPAPAGCRIRPGVGPAMSRK